MFKNLRISWKLGVGFGAVVAITLALGGYGWNAFRQVGVATDLVTEATSAVDDLGQLRTDRMNFSIHGFEAAEGKDKDYTQVWGETITSLNDQIAKLHGTKGVTQQQVDLLVKAAGGMKQYDAAHAQTVEARRTQDEAFKNWGDIGWAITSEETGKALEQIVSGVESTAKMIADIATATVEQAANAREVSAAIQGITEVTEQTAAGSEEMASSSEELGAQSASLRGLVSRFKTENSGSWQAAAEMAEA